MPVTTRKPTVIVHAVPHSAFHGVFEPDNPNHLGIVIADSDDPAPFGTDTEPTNRFTLVFDDEEDFDQPNTWPITDVQAMFIAGLVNGAISAVRASETPILLITVTCKGGKCRSAGVACAIDGWWHGVRHATQRFLDTAAFLPNRLVFNEVWESLDDLSPAPEWDVAFDRNREIFDATVAATL